ncbi:MAG: hypothetical protein IKI31_01375, partial [Treponema sp.]|nr:hypothetical protein [Treponema sp.]
PLAGEVLPDEPLSCEVLPDEPLSSEMLPDEPLTSEVLPSEQLASEALPSEPLLSEALPDEQLTSEMLPDEPLTSEALPSDTVDDEMYDGEITPELRLFMKLRSMCKFLPDEKKEDFMQSNKCDSLDYIIARLQGKSRLIETAEKLCDDNENVEGA